MSEKHPREETQAERDEAYKELNKLARRLLFHNGTAYNYDIEARSAGFREMRVSVATYLTKEGDEVDVTLQRALTTEGERHNSVEIAKLYDRNPLGKQTRYYSRDGGPFTRDDVDGNELGVVEVVETASNSLSKAFLTVAGVNMIASQAAQQAEKGLDGFPISAQETRDLIEVLETSTFKPPRK